MLFIIHFEREGCCVQLFFGLTFDNANQVWFLTIPPKVFKNDDWVFGYFSGTKISDAGETQCLLNPKIYEQNCEESSWKDHAL